MKTKKQNKNYLEIDFFLTNRFSIKKTRIGTGIEPETERTETRANRNETEPNWGNPVHFTIVARTFNQRLVRVDGCTQCRQDTLCALSATRSRSTDATPKHLQGPSVGERATTGSIKYPGGMQRKSHQPLWLVGLR